jgi:hypothetical protein
VGNPKALTPALLREAELDRETIAIVVKKIEDGDGEH